MSNPISLCAICCCPLVSSLPPAFRGQLAKSAAGARSVIIEVLVIHGSCNSQKVVRVKLIKLNIKCYHMNVKKDGEKNLI